MYPILKYPGAKWRVAPWILSHFPKHESYVEPYFGSGTVLFNKTPSRIETVNDLDGDVVNFFRICRERPDELAAALYLTPWSREERQAAYEPASDNLERARRFAVKCWQSFGAFPQKSRGWRNSTGNKPHGGPENPKLWMRLPQCVCEAADRLRGTQIENRPALDVIRRFNGSNVLIYADPPYVHDTRTAACDAYNHEMTDADHEALLMALNASESMVILSGYDCDLYNDMLRGWHKDTLNTTAERGARRTETLWINPSAFHAANDMQTRMCV